MIHDTQITIKICINLVQKIILNSDTNALKWNHPEL